MKFNELVEQVDSLKLKIESQDNQMYIYADIIQRLISLTESLTKELDRLKREPGGYKFPPSSKN